MVAIAVERGGEGGTKRNDQCVGGWGGGED